MWDDLYYLPPLNMTNVERARLSRVIERHDRRHRGVLCRLCMSAGLHVHVHVMIESAQLLVPGLSRHTTISSTTPASSLAGTVSTSSKVWSCSSRAW